MMPVPIINSRQKTLSMLHMDHREHKQVMRSFPLTKYACQGRVWTGQPRCSNRNQTSKDRERKDTPPPDIQGPQTADQPTEEEKKCQLDGKNDKPPEGGCGILLLGNLGDFVQEVKEEATLGTIKDHSE